MSKRPLWIKLLFGGVGLAILIFTVCAPSWPIFLMYAIAILLLCPNFNVLGGSCHGSVLDYAMPWIIFILVIFGFISLIKLFVKDR